MAKRWSLGEIDLLRNAYTTMPTREIYSLFPRRSKKSVQRKATELGLKRPKVISIDLKTCTKCNRLKPIDSFGPDTRQRDLHQSHCYQCVYSYTKERRKKDPSIVRKEYARRKHARIIGTTTIEMVYDKTKGFCYLCGQYIDRVLTHPDPFSLSMDHKIPISRGGEHSFENLYPTHLRCNLKKQDKVIDG